MVDKKAKIIFNIPFFGRISFLDKVLFAKHLALMIKSGLSLREAVAGIEEQAKSKKFKRVLDDIIKNIDNGQTLADSLARHPRVFNDLYVNMIRVGEESGTLEENLRHLSSQLGKSYELKKKVKAAMIYPAIVLIATLSLGAALSFFVLPKLIPLFKSFKIELPLPTRVLLWLTENIQRYGFYLFWGLVVLLVVLIIISRLKPIKSIIHKILLKLPFTGTISRNINLALFSRTLGTLIKSGVPIVRSLDIAVVTLKNLTYQKYLKEVVLKVQQGQQMATYFKSHSKLFPATFSQMVGAGEKTGKLEDSLLYLAEFYEKEVDNASKNLATSLEPILLIIIGLVVTFVALSIIMPIYQLTRGLRG